VATAVRPRPRSGGQPEEAREVDAHALARALSDRVEGEVRFSHGSRALYANDASVYRQLPLGVVLPKSVDDVVAAMETCREHGAPIFGRGCGTGLAGQSVNNAVLIDFSKYLKEILEIDWERQVARVQPGIVLDRLRETAEERNLTFGPDPATHSRCTLGGMIGNNSCGVHSIMAGVTADNIEALDVLLYDGTRLLLKSRYEADEIDRLAHENGRFGGIVRDLLALRDRYAGLIHERYPEIPRRISGYNLDRLLPEQGFNLAAALVGTESTCALTLEAHCRLIDSPQERALVLLGYEDGPTAADQVPEIIEYDPIGLEMFDQRLVDHELKKGFKRRPELLPGGQAWLLVEFGAMDKDEVDAQAERLMEAMRKKDGPHVDVKLYEDPDEEAQVWEIREGGVGNSKMPGEHPGWPSWEDAAVPPERTGDYLRDLEALCKKHGREISCYYGHVGHGCVHTRIDWDFLTQEGVANYRRFMEDAGDLIAEYGGSLSGEHGDGQARAELLPKMFGDELVQAFREFKAIWDPDGMMNPGKVSDPYPLDTNLRMAPPYRTREVKTHFRYPQDAGSFAAAGERCFGVGACRDQGGVMCPSYQVTFEEQHSTRGRARLLFEMMRGELEDGWRDESVKEALGLCLACKGCLHECPVRVDIATYKAEFLHHYYERRLRPLREYLLGLIPWEARIASHAPRLANALTRGPLAAAGKRLAGIAPERPAPAFAEQTFKSWFAARGGTHHPNGKPVLLWPDTFNNYFHPEVAIATTQALEAAGFQVRLPEQWLCCGRPLYDYGMLDLAEHQLRTILDALRDEIRAGTPVISVEPSCGAVFRNELTNLLPDDEDAKRLAEQTHTIGEFFAQHAHEIDLPKLDRKALVHFHCHQRATSDVDCDTKVLDRLGLDYEVLDDGCCGLAGSFGYEAGDKYEVSMRVGEQKLLPAVRDADPDTLVITDGFSCRSQIEHGAEGRRSVHLAEVLALSYRTNGLTDGSSAQAEPRNRAGRTALAATGIGIAAAGGAFVLGRRLRR
jgi:FAD/FMN-containing dehydrogenase/Fe-S oxidoreductase